MAIRFKVGYTVSFIAFVLHFIWEYLQCAPLFIHGDFGANIGVSPPTHLAMIQAILGDVGLTWIAYFTVSLFVSDKNWLAKPWPWKAWLAILVSGLVLSFSIEFMALSLGWWSYTAIAPLLFGKISLIPVLQLLILFPLTFKLASNITKNKAPSSNT